MRSILLIIALLLALAIAQPPKRPVLDKMQRECPLGQLYDPDTGKCVETSNRDKRKVSLPPIGIPYSCPAMFWYDEECYTCHSLSSSHEAGDC